MTDKEFLERITAEIASRTIDYGKVPKVGDKLRELLKECDRRLANEKAKFATEYPKIRDYDCLYKGKKVI